jgi:hypothetical protein
MIHPLRRTFAPCAAFFFIALTGRAETQIDPQVARVIAGTKAIDNHAHPLRATNEGEVDLDWDQLSSDVDRFLPPVRLRPDNPELVNAWRALFGYAHKDMNEAHLAELIAKKKATRAAKGDAFPAWVLDQIGTETMLANRVTMGRGLVAPRFRWVAFVDALAMPLDNSASANATPDRKVYYGDLDRLLHRYLAARKVEALPDSLGDYLRLIVTPTLEEQEAGGAVAIKFEAAYLRSLAFEKPTMDEAAAVYSHYTHGGVPLPNEYKTLQDFIYHFMAREAGRLKLAVHIHVGAGVGGYFDQKEARPILLMPLFNDPELRQTNFVMLHAAWPYPDEVASMLTKPNVYADFSAMTFLLYPQKLAASLRTWLEFQPEKVFFATDAFALGPDVGWEDLAWLTADTGRKALGLALTAMLRDGIVTETRAAEIARAVLHDNAAKLYGLEQAPPTTR